MQEKIIETETVLDIEKAGMLFGTPKNILDQYKRREVLQTFDDAKFKEASSLKNSLEQYIYYIYY